MTHRSAFTSRVSLLSEKPLRSTSEPRQSPAAEQQLRTTVVRRHGQSPFSLTCCQQAGPIESEGAMSGIGSSGFGPGVNPYAGNVNSTKGTDSARGDAAARSTDADHSAFSQNLNGAGETERSDDRDADAFFTASGNNGGQQEESEQQSDTDDAATLSSPASGPSVIDQPLDDHRGNMINFDV